MNIVRSIILLHLFGGITAAVLYAADILDSTGFVVFAFIVLIGLLVQIALVLVSLVEKK